jgi:diaminopimelate decarboxylase
VVFTGVGKTPDELRSAVPLGLRSINAESPGELERIDALARRLGTRARVAVRLNPDIEAGAHPHISTGRRINKFGVPIELGRALYRKMAGRPAFNWSGSTRTSGRRSPASRHSDRPPRRWRLLAGLRDDGIAPEHLDLGGGLGISYDGAATASIEDYAAAVLPAVAPTGLTILIEPGRAVVGSSGVLLARVVDVKAYFGAKPFVVLDTGMTELIRPALYGAYHRIEPVTPRAGPRRTCDIVGPLCESSDVVGSDRDLLPPKSVTWWPWRGLRTTMASTTTAARPCEVLVDCGAVFGGGRRSR